METLGNFQWKLVLELLEQKGEIKNIFHRVRLPLDAEDEAKRLAHFAGRRIAGATLALAIDGVVLRKENEGFFFW